MGWATGNVCRSLWLGVGDVCGFGTGIFVLVLGFEEGVHGWWVWVGQVCFLVCVRGGGMRAPFGVS